MRFDPFDEALLKTLFANAEKWTASFSESSIKD